VLLSALSICFSEEDQTPNA